MSEKRNIAIIIPGGIGTGHNNIGVPVLERIVRLLSADFNITVFQLFPINANFKVNGYELIDIYSSAPIVKYLRFYFTFRKIQRTKKFEAVHGFWAFPCGFLAVFVGRIFRIKSIVSVLGGDAIALPEIRYGQLLSGVKKKLILWTLKHAQEVNTLTKYLIDNLSKHGLQRKDVKIIPWGIDTSLFAFREKPLSEPVQFLHIGNLHPVKDQETLLRAFKIISDKVQARLTIIGEGVSEAFVKKLITQLDLVNKVVIQGLLPYEELPAYYRNADVLLHTSRSEGQSEVITEAMSCGVLVCGTQAGLIYDLPDCCVSVSIRDFETLGNEVLKLLSSPQRMNEIRTHAHAWTKVHSIRWTAERIKELY
ncbi:MAG TPA: glycosyltransferase [Cyclobacteriaceae bacterium]|nr:glycosyltransferase [Cyclobacteriaceae bacterium]